MFSFTVISFAILLHRAAASQQHLVGYEPLMNVADHVSYRILNRMFDRVADEFQMTILSG